jgi:hypothetical protein
VAVQPHGGPWSWIFDARPLAGHLAVQITWFGINTANAMEALQIRPERRRCPVGVCSSYRQRRTGYEEDVSHVAIVARLTAKESRAGKYVLTLTR